MDVQRLGVAIRERRLAKDLSQEDLARRADISASYLSRLERGHNPRPGADILRKLLTALGVGTIDELLANVSLPPLAMSTADDAAFTPAQEEAIRRIFRETFSEFLEERGSELPPPTPLRPNQ